MSKFTKGEWEVKAVNTAWSVKIGKKTIADLWNTCDTDKAALANAHLIAAAPDMYKLLQEIKHVLLKVGNGPSKETNQIEKLLAKARGE